MFSRRRSRGHYDPQQYNTGISTQSASASAAANAFYMRQLGPSAAAEALRRHSLDQNGANAVRSFQQDSPQSMGQRGNVPSRRANSLTTRSYQVVHTPSRAPVRAGRPPSYMSPGARRNSMSSDRSNSLTRTHTVVNRDANGRTLSLTTTTVRQMGSFELVSTKDVPLATPGSTQDYMHADSLLSMDSELRGIREEPEEDQMDRLNRLSDPIDTPLHEEPEEDELPIRRNAGRKANRLIADDVDHDEHHEKALNAVLNDTHRSEDGEQDENSSDGSLSNGTVSDATMSPESPRSPQPRATTRPAASGFAGGSTIGHASEGAEHLPAPELPGSAPLHREVSPSRSALKNSTTTPKSKVSFGGADEPYVYESYEYEEKTLLAQNSAAATAAARARANKALAAAQAPPKRLVMTQPTHNVEKRASQTSLSGRTQTARRPATHNQPYPHSRPWDTNVSPNSNMAPNSNNAAASQGQTQARANSESYNQPWDPEYSDAPNVLPVPARSSARPNRTQTGINGLPQIPSGNDSSGNDELRAQAIALAKSQFTAASEGGQVGPSHHYRSLLDDDAASVHSDSSFSRTQPSNNNARPSAKPTRMRSLRQPATPSLRSGGPPKGKQSLLSQPPPNFNVNNNKTDKIGPGLRTYSLRNTTRPDPASLLAGTGGSYGKPNNNGFRSRITDSDSEDEGAGPRSNRRSAPNGKITIGDMFSPSTDVKDIFKTRASSDGAMAAELGPKKKGGFFKRIFGRN